MHFDQEYSRQKCGMKHYLNDRQSVATQFSPHFLGKSQAFFKAWCHYASLASTPAILTAQQHIKTTNYPHSAAFTHKNSSVLFFFSIYSSGVEMTRPMLLLVNYFMLFMPDFILERGSFSQSNLRSRLFSLRLLL